VVAGRRNASGLDCFEQFEVRWLGNRVAILAHR
jgi:hypothetical protein